MSLGTIGGRAAGAALAAFIGLCALAPGAGQARAVNARVLGTFSMRASVTAAVGVRGEHPGQVLTRRWVISASACRQDVCARLRLRRQRSDGQHSDMTLRQTGVGRYKGTGVFYVPLRCEGRVYRRGSRAPYRISLTVVAATEVGGVLFARRITATYVNAARTDATPCPLGPSHDAARYRGIAVSPLPVAPAPSFIWTVDAADRVASFTNTSSPGAGGARLIGSLWSFGDPASGARDGSILADPEHAFSAPGEYEVSLTEIDAEGLSATATEAVTVPVPVPIIYPIPPRPSGSSRSVASTRPSAPMRRAADSPPGLITA